MRRLLAFIAFMSLVCGSVEGQTVKDGFRGFEWGTPFSEIDTLYELVPHGGDEDTKHYKVNIDSLGGAEIDVITFMFYEDKFHGVFVWVVGAINSSALLDALTEVYGRPEQPNRYVESYIWSSKKTHRFFDINSITGDGQLSMISEYYSKSYSEKRQQKTEKAKDDF